MDYSPRSQKALKLHNMLYEFYIYIFNVKSFIFSKTYDWKSAKLTNRKRLDVQNVLIWLTFINTSNHPWSSYYNKNAESRPLIRILWKFLILIEIRLLQSLNSNKHINLIDKLYLLKTKNYFTNFAHRPDFKCWNTTEGYSFYLRVKVLK